MQSGTKSRSPTHPSCQQLSHPSIQLTCFGFDTQDRQHIFCVTTKEAIVYANFGQLSFLSGRVCVRPTLRRYAMATPASVHCMSRQLVFVDLSCTGFRRRLGTLSTTSSSPSTASSRIGSCAAPGSSGSGFSGLTGSDPAGNLSRTQKVASHLSCFLSVSCRCCTHCSLCTQLYNRSVVNLSSPSGSTHRFFFAIFEPLWNR